MEIPDCVLRKESADKFRSMIELPRQSVFEASDHHMERHISMSRITSGLEFYTGYIQVPVIVAMVGLPARGKTYISKKLCRYLKWMGFKTREFNLGEYRRLRSEYHGHDVFEGKNEEGKHLREECAEAALKDTIEYFKAGGEIAIIDATNSTIERRQKLNSFVSDHGYKLFYIESICNDKKIVERNIKEVKTSSPDYVDTTESKVMDDFLQRIDHYAELYVPLDAEKEPHSSFIQLINAGEETIIYNHEGAIQSRIIYYLMNLHILPRNIYFTKHGESEYNLQDRIGGDPSLSPRGQQYAKALADFVNNMKIPDLRVWTSTMIRTIQTAKHILYPQERWRILQEINTGVCNDLTYTEVREKYPNIQKARTEDKFNFRYPKGESYKDLIERLEPVIMELERQSNVMVVCHEGILRCLMGYFLDIPSSEIPYIYVPLHTFFKLTPVTYGCKVQHIRFPIPCVETFKPQAQKKEDSCQCVYEVDYS